MATAASASHSPHSPRTPRTPRTPCSPQTPSAVRDPGSSPVNRPPRWRVSHETWLRSCEEYATFFAEAHLIAERRNKRRNLALVLFEAVSTAVISVFAFSDWCNVEWVPSAAGVTAVLIMISIALQRILGFADKSTMHHHAAKDLLNLVREVNEMFTLDASVREPPSVVLKRVRNQLNRLQERSIALSPSLLQQVKAAHALPQLDVAAQNQSHPIDAAAAAAEAPPPPIMWHARMYLPDVPASVSNSRSASPSYQTPIPGRSGGGSASGGGKAPAAHLRAVASAPLPRRTLEYASSSFDALFSSDGDDAAANGRILHCSPEHGVPCSHRHRAASEPVFPQTTSQESLEPA